MLKIKFFVLGLFFSYNIFACRTKYCKICPDHTLCKYVVPGRGQQCIGYDTSGLLTDGDIKNILHKINDRRDFIAVGHSRFLPTAANMKKITWSEELATFAQRWVDQCDQLLKPDRKDQCRDLDNLEVGQSIATITGVSSRYSIRSFVEMWFMEYMDYSGSVTYYNKSRDHKSDHFTQLIWADTDKVGCGKAKFFVKNVKPTIVERLVCNFAPKANVDGKPVYTIGYAATQCNSGMGRDKHFPGLCSHTTKQNDGIIDRSTLTAPSFLRIRNLFTNDSERQEIDPIYNNLKQMKKDLNGMDNHFHQDSIEASNYFNNSYDIKRSYPYKSEMFWNNQQLNNSRHNGQYPQKREKGHSRVYHGHHHRNEFDSIHPETIDHNAQKFEHTSTALNFYMKHDYRKHSIEEQCTRKSEKKRNNYDMFECPCKQKVNKCTRGQKNNCRQNNNCQKNRCQDYESQTMMSPIPYTFCACNSFSTIYPPSSNRRMQNTNCDCIQLNCPTKPCPGLLRTLRDISDEKLEKQNDFQYYDMMSSIAQKNTSKIDSRVSPAIPSVLLDTNHCLSCNKHFKTLSKRKQVKRNDSEGKRTIIDEEENFKPFWQMDEYVNRNQPQLKSIRYTTLSRKKSQKYNRIKQSSRTSIKTESITIRQKEQSKSGRRVTEKYLSFDELMHLRKHNAEDLNGRRYYDDKHILRESSESTNAPKSTTVTSSSTKETTQEYSFNTPFMRMKHCTRKLTCTWTAASLTDSAGSIILGGIGGLGGSRTPPGYVDGCTRTSTCTRDYMNRNKMATLPVETTSPEPDPGDDEDYCERRSINRRSNNNLTIGSRLKIPFMNTSSKQNKSSFIESFFRPFNNWILYNKNSRNKRYGHRRDESNKTANYKVVKRESKDTDKYENNLLSYGDLYYYVVSKIIEMWKTDKSLYSRHKCLCNCVNKLLYCNLYLFMTILNNIYKMLY